MKKIWNWIKNIFKPERQDPHLVMYEEIENESGEFFKEDELEEGKRKTIKRLYKESQIALTTNNTEFAKDLLIHILFLHRRNLRAKKLLNYGLNLETGGYKIFSLRSLCTGFCISQVGT